MLQLTDDLRGELQGPATTAEFEVLYERHYRDVYRYVLGLTRSLDDADDVSAETFERAVAADRAPDRHRPVALLDRLLHHATTVVTSGDSYRMKEARQRGGGLSTKA